MVVPQYVPSDITTTFISLFHKIPLSYLMVQHKIPLSYLMVQLKCTYTENEDTEN